MTTILNTTFLKIKVLLPEICWQNTSNVQIPRPSTTRRVFGFLEKARVALANTLNGSLHGLFVLSRTWRASRLSSACTCPFLTDHSCLPNVFTSSQGAPSRGILPTHAPVKILPSQNYQLAVGTAKTIRFPNSHDGHEEGRQVYVLWLYCSFHRTQRVTLAFGVGLTTGFCLSGSLEPQACSESPSLPKTHFLGCHWSQSSLGKKRREIQRTPSVICFTL